MASTVLPVVRQQCSATAFTWWSTTGSATGRSVLLRVAALSRSTASFRALFMNDLTSVLGSVDLHVEVVHVHGPLHFAVVEVTGPGESRMSLLRSVFCK